MNTNIQFPQGPFLDQNGNISLEWWTWLQNPQVLSIKFATALDVTSGGTGITSGTSGGVLAFTGAETITSSGLLAQYQLVAGGGAGGVPATIGSVGSVHTVLHGNASGLPTFGAVSLVDDVTGTLPVTSGGTGDVTLTQHGVLLGNGNNAIQVTAVGSNGNLLIGQTGVDPTWNAVSGYGTLGATGVLTVNKVLGTTTNDSAAAGDVGEYVSSSIAIGSAVGLTTATAKDITSIALTGGDWDVWVNATFTGNAATTVDRVRCSISGTSNTLNASNGRISATVFQPAALIFTVGDQMVNVGPIRQSLAGATTLYMVAEANFAVNSLSGYGIMQARRRR